jgi:hypothetical protein
MQQAVTKYNFLRNALIKFFWLKPGMGSVIYIPRGKSRAIVKYKGHRVRELRNLDWRSLIQKKTSKSMGCLEVKN